MGQTNMKTLLSMKKILLTAGLLLASAMVSTAQSAWQDGCLMVDGKPFTLLAGELHNSTTGSVQNMEGVWRRMADKNLNSVIAAASWELVEPVEGQFHFAEVDAMIDGAREAGLKLVILWFGSWKNGTSTYAPAWVKTNPKRFPRACFSDGSTTNTLSTLGKETRKADAKAFAALMAHIREYDKAGTVIMVQVENEMGTLDMLSSYTGRPNRAMRDYSPAAEKAFKGQVPQQLIAYLNAHKGQLNPAVEAAWKRGGYRNAGTWEEVFGKGGLSLKEGSWQDTYPYLTEEIFNTWNYAAYVQEVAAAGKKELALPMFVNAWLKQTSQPEPGKYPSGGPNAHMMDIWRAGAPAIDFLAADIYATGLYDWVCSTFSASGNPLVIPETKSSPDGASRALYTFGKYKPICYAPFGIDGGGLVLSADRADLSFDKVYGLLGRYMDEIRTHTPGKDMEGLLVDPQADRNSDTAVLGDYSFTLAPMNLGGFAAVAGVDAGSASPAQAPVSGVLILQRGPGEFLLLGGVGAGSVRISSARGKQTDLLSVDEIRIGKGGEEYLHRLNGDETSMGVVFHNGEAQAFLVKLYDL